VPEVVTAGVALVTMLFRAPLIALTPQATVRRSRPYTQSASSNPSEFREILSFRPTEFNWHSLRSLESALGNLAESHRPPLPHPD